MFDSEEKERQSELFSDLPVESKKPRRTPFRLGRVSLSVSYESILIVTIGLVMLLIVCYSLGVEQGKQIAGAKIEDSEIKEVEIIAERQIIKEKEAEKKAEETAPKPPAKKIKVKVAAAPKYTIQVATFRTEDSAEKEKQRLKKKGYQPFVISRGRFSEICVGAYQKINEATPDLENLKKIYGDCYVRNR